MCGLSGFIDLKKEKSSEELSQTVTRMTDTLFHRGPDGGDVWVDGNAHIALGHRRLAIVDLSAAGHQPMTSHDGRYMIVYNGEVYNAGEIRDDLVKKGHVFGGHSDTEVILNSFSEFGIEATVKRLIGMFAIALWDKKEQLLTLIRDRIGIKPMYWGQDEHHFFFASELKAFHQLPHFNPTISKSAIAAYLRYTYVPQPYTIYDGIHKLGAGCILSYKAGQDAKITRYWDICEIAEQAKNNPLELSEAQATKELDRLITDAVGRRMIADVKLGAFLSGGVDSSCVVAIMQKLSEQKVKTFSIGFDVDGFNEAEYAKAVADHIGTEHHELYITTSDAQDVIPSLCSMYDEPFSDSSQIPTYLVSKMTRDHVTVALSGDGGDELFAGYNRYAFGQRLHNIRQKIPNTMSHALSKLLKIPSPQTWDKLLSPLSGKFLPNMIGDKIHKAAPILAMDSPFEIYKSLITHLEQVTPQNQEVIGDGWTRTQDVQGLNFIETMQLLDLNTYLPDDILTKVDRASMAASLEARVPLLDHRLIEWSWRLPQHHKIKDNQTKYILRNVLYQYVPRTLIERPKAGFAIPLKDWLKGGLKEWAYDLLQSDILYTEMGIERHEISKKWDEHQSGTRNWQYQLWAVLMLADWAKKWHPKT